jgi:predicted RNA-binding protein YlqC (UPF0109 family)
MSSIDQQFVEFVVKSLVSNPDGVVVERRIDEKGVLLELTVDPEDLGRVIGKRGATAQSLRTLLRALGTKNDARYNLKIIDNGVGDYHHDDNRGDERPVQSDAAASGEDSDTAAPRTTSSAHTMSEAPEASEPSDRVKHLRRDLEDLDD